MTPEPPAPELPHFRNRGENVSRLEGLSDAVFGFAITLLVVSLTVPTNFDLLVAQLRSLPAFAVTFAIVATIWFSQYVFFRRFGLSDTFTIVLNLVLLFVVLFYVYPLKFLFALALQINEVTIRQDQIPLLFVIYGAGFMAVNLLLAALYVRAYRLSDDLGMSPWERYVTRLSIIDHTSVMAIGLLSAGLAQIVPEPYTAPFAGFIYFLVGVDKFVVGSIRGRRARSWSASANQPPETHR